MDPFEPMALALLDYLDGQADAAFIVKSDVGEDEPTLAGQFFRTWEQMPAIERQALDACRGRVLDIGAGGGCHSMVLAQRGLEVWPLDICPKMDEVLRRQGFAHVICQDVCELQGMTFDTLLLMMNGIGIVGNLAGLERFLRHAAALVGPGGQMLLDSHDYRFTANATTRLYARGRFRGEIHLRIEYKGLLGEPFAWLFIDPPMLQRYARKTGWRCEAIGYGTKGHYLARLERQG